MIPGSKLGILTLSTLFALSLAGSANAPLAADSVPGVTDTEVLIGGTDPFSGPASAYSAVGKGSQAYFSYINDHGGVNGRKITYKDLDDAYSPPQAVQLAHQLVEQDHVFAMFGTLGTPSNTAIRPYLNENKVPQVFIATGASKWAKEYKQFPWTIGWMPDYQSEAIIYATSLAKTAPNAKIAALYQNDDFGNDYITGLNTGLGAKAKTSIVKTASYEVTDPDVSSQISTLKASGADTLFIFATPKFAVQALVAVAQQSWHPQIYLTNVSSSQSVLRAAAAAGGPGATNGVISTLYVKDPSDPKYNSDAGITLYKQIMAKYLPGEDTANGFFTAGMGYGFTLVDALKHAGRDLTREKLMTAVTNLKENDNPFLENGISVVTTPTNHFPITQEQVVRYESGKWTDIGTIVDARPYIKEETH